MANDRQVIAYLSPADLAGVMAATGVVTVRETVVTDGKPVIHASLKVVNAATGEELPGGLPFSVVMFKGPNEPGYSNIAIGTIIPVAELKVALPRDYFNFCNQRFRFTRVFPIDHGAFVVQMDMVLKNTTREYLKFNFGLWGALYTQILFELMGRGRESLVNAAEAFAQAHMDFATQIASTPDVAAVVPEPVVSEPVAEPVMTLDAEAIVPEVANDVVAPPVEAEPVIEASVAPEGEAPAVEAAVAEASVSEAVVEEPVAHEEPASETVAEAPVEAPAAEAVVADAVELPPVEAAPLPDLSIAEPEPVAAEGHEPVVGEAEPVKEAVSA